MADPLTTAPTVAEVLEAGGYRLLSDREVALLREGFEAGWLAQITKTDGDDNPLEWAFRPYGRDDEADLIPAGFQAFLTQRQQEKETPKP